MIQQLLSRANQRGGTLTLDDIFDILETSDTGTLAANIDHLLYELEELGIELDKEQLLLERPAHLDALEAVDADPSAERDEHHEAALGDINGITSDDPVGLYFRQMVQEPLLTAEEEIRLAKRIDRGRRAHERLQQPDAATRSPSWRRHMEHRVRDGQRAREHLSRANTRLVVSIAKRYMSQGMPFPDLIQEGNVGLMRAVDKYDYTRGNRFSTYATWWIRQAITRALAQKTRTIRIPLHMIERIRQMYRTAQDLEQQLGRRATPEEIGTIMNMPADTIRAMMDASAHAIALERPVGEDGDSEFGDFIEDQDSPSPVDMVTQHLLQEAIEEALSELTPRQSHILRLRFGLSGGDPHTLEEIANQFNLSRERIRQLEKEAIRRLRHPQIANLLRDYLA